MGRDIDDAVLASTNQSISSNITGLVSVMTLSFSCENIPNLDTFTRSDGMAIVYQKNGNEWHKIGNTEVIHDCLDPKWVRSFDVQYHFEKKDFFKVVVYDIDDF
jgi:hypothetical protein